jgi:hypothetical protein
MRQWLFRCRWHCLDQRCKLSDKTVGARNKCHRDVLAVFVKLSTILEATDSPADAATDVAKLTAAEVAELTNPPPTLAVAEVAALPAAEVAAPAAEEAADPAAANE